MTGTTAVTFIQHVARVAPKVAPPRRLLSTAELVDALAESVAPGAAQPKGLAWRDVRLIPLSFHGCGETQLPAAAFYTMLVFAGHTLPAADGDGSYGDSADPAGAMIVSGPGRSVRLRWTQPRSATLVCIDPRVLRTAAAQCGLGAEAPALRSGSVPSDPVCERLLGALAEEAKGAAYPVQELIVESIVSALAFRLVVRFASEAARAPGAPGALNIRAFRDVSAYIEQRLDEHLSLDDLARIAGVSRFHFARQFRLRTGESPMGFLLRARIERGKRLLRETAAPIGDVAAALGFADQSHFTRTFKRLVGVPPSAYKGGGTRPTAVRGPLAASGTMGDFT